MTGRFSVRWQTVLIVMLFVGSLGLVFAACGLAANVYPALFAHLFIVLLGAALLRWRRVTRWQYCWIGFMVQLRVMASSKFHSARASAVHAAHSFTSPADSPARALASSSPLAKRSFCAV